MNNLHRCVLVIAGVLIVIALTVHLDRVPPPWWDEGWTLSVARNWVELGHYGRLLIGVPMPRGLEMGFPVTGSVALSFWLFGIGIYQARLVAVVITLAALVLLYELSRRFFNRSIAIATLAVLLLLGGRVDINPLILGRQVLGEVPAQCFLLAGYLCLIAADKRPLLFMPAVIGFWTLALLSKIQVPPFWTTALVLPLSLTLFRRQWRGASLLGAALIGTLLLKLGLEYLLVRASPPSSVTGLTPLIALVFLPEKRLTVLAETLQYGMPTLLALCWGLWSFVKSESRFQSHIDLVRFSYLVLAGSWFTWFVTLSIGWSRYMFPPAFLASVFVAAMLDQWTNHFDVAYTINQAASVLKKFRFHRRNLAALAATLLIALSFGQTVKVLYGAYVIEADNSIYDTVRFLNTATPPNALIETFESELLFLLNRRYHYPPDQTHVELIRRMHFDQRVKIDYDPLAANPDYLVVGHQSKYWVLYDPYLKTGDFRLLRNYSEYDIYERIR
jgi:hypothetical protein